MGWIGRWELGAWIWEMHKSSRNVNRSMWFLDEAQPHEDADHDPECHDQEGQPNYGLQGGVLGATAIRPVVAPVVKMDNTWVWEHPG